MAKDARPNASPDALRAFSRSLPMALLRAREAVMARFRPMLREHGLTEQQWRVLRALASADEPLRFREIAEQTYLSMPSLSRLLKTLETRRLIRRAVHEDDLRAAQVTLAPKGEAIIATIAPASEAQYEDITESIGSAEIERLYALLERLPTVLSPPHGEPDDRSPRSRASRSVAR